MRKNILDRLKTMQVNITVARSGFGYVIEVKHRDGSTSTFRFFNHDERILIGSAIAIVVMIGVMWWVIAR